MPSRTPAQAPKPTPASTRTPDAAGATPRRSFRLSGRSAKLDPRQHAARGDIADIALAGTLFAPHYAMPLPRMCGWQAAAVYAAASKDSEQVNQLLPGEDFAVLDTSGGWAWGYSVRDHYVGYVEAALLTAPAAASHVVARPGAVMLARPDIHAPSRAVLPIGARVQGTVQGDFLETERGFVSLIRLRPTGEPVADPVAVAEQLVGMPYLWGGRGAGGIDCSGLVQLSYGFVGIDLPRDSDQQAEAGTGIPDDMPLRRGDLLFFPEHVAMMLDGSRVIHATAHWMGVAVEPAADLVARQGAPFARRRILP